MRFADLGEIEFITEFDERRPDGEKHFVCFWMSKLRGYAAYRRGESHNFGRGAERIHNPSDNDLCGAMRE